MHPVQPNAAQTEWRERVRSLGLGLIVHHATDRTMRIKGVGNIGQWWLIPCRSDTDHRRIHEMGSLRKIYEKRLFARVCVLYRKKFAEEPPLPPGVYSAIMEFRR